MNIHLPEVNKGLSLSHPDGYKPYPHQVDAASWQCKMGNPINGDDMGVGKTIEAIMSVLANNALPCLIICPASLKLNWKQEIEAWTDKKALILDNSVKDKWYLYANEFAAFGAFKGIYQFFIVNYESLGSFFILGKRNPNEGLRVNNIIFTEYVQFFKAVIIDEAHRNRNTDTKSFKYTYCITNHLSKGNVFQLTGTPVVNGKKDLLALIAIARKEHLFGGMSKLMGYYLHKDTPESELNAILQQFYFRRDKAEVIKNLPDKIRQTIPIQISNVEEYNAAIDDLEAYFREFTDKTEGEILRAMKGEVMVRISTLRQITARGKLNMIKDYVKNITDSGKKIILFVMHKKIASELKNTFSKAVTILGEDSYIQRDYNKNKFQTDKDTNIIICSIKSAGVGLTLTAASVVGFVESPWHHADSDQAEDRAYRNGVKHDVHALWFEGSGTIDRRIRSIIERKRSESMLATGGKDYTKEDVEDELILDLLKSIRNGKLENLKLK